MKLFLFQSEMKNVVKDINFNFMSNKLNKKKKLIEKAFAKRANL